MFDPLNDPNDFDVVGESLITTIILFSFFIAWSIL